MFTHTAVRTSDLTWLWLLHYWKTVCFVLLVSNMQKLTGFCYMDGSAVCKTSVTYIKLTFRKKLHKYVLIYVDIDFIVLLWVEGFLIKNGEGAFVYWPFCFSAVWKIPCWVVECVYLVLNMYCTHTHTHTHTHTQAYIYICICVYKYIYI